MFKTLHDNFYPEELTVKKNIIQHSSFLDRMLRSWKTRSKIRIRTERRILNKIVYRRIQRLYIWQKKQIKAGYRFKGYIDNLLYIITTNIIYVFFKELYTLFFMKSKSCCLRRLKKKQLKLAKYYYI